MLSNEKIEIKCPSCQKILSYTVDQLERGNSSKCPRCGSRIRFEEKRSGAVSKLERDVEKAIEDIPKKITATIE